MATRRQERFSRLIKEAVSDAILNHLNDPRIEGLVSVTKVEMTPDLRNADVYISVLGKNQASQNKTFEAINHAKSRVQFFVGSEIESKFCPILRFRLDESFKKTLDTLNLIENAASEYTRKGLNENPEE